MFSQIHPSVGLQRPVIRDFFLPGKEDIISREVSLSVSGRNEQGKAPLLHPVRLKITRRADVFGAMSWNISVVYACFF